LKQTQRIIIARDAKYCGGWDALRPKNGGNKVIAEKRPSTISLTFGSGKGVIGYSADFSFESPYFLS